MENISKYLTVREVSERLGVTEKWVRDLIQVKELRATKIGKWRIKPEDLQAFIDSRYNKKE
jgi:excisionase family DNA binding protein